ncbi:MAG: hypothetical protein U0836_01660 [Pirellulales bacterium]
MSSPLPASECLDREFLEIRARLLQAAAALDRIERSEGNVAADTRLVRIGEALAVLAGPGVDRAERIQLIFSRRYEENWRAQFGLRSEAGRSG